MFGENMIHNFCQGKSRKQQYLANTSHTNNRLINLTVISGRISLANDGRCACSKSKLRL